MKKGFTLIELLVVIAIISILAAITFPVFARAKDSAYRSSDISNLNSIRTALQLYKADQGAYPPSLLGYATTYAGGSTPTTSDILPANQVVGALYPRRIDSLETLRPAYVRPSTSSLNTEFTTAVWAPGAVGTNIGDQKYGPNDGPVKRCVDRVNKVAGPNYYYRVSGYDSATTRTGASTGAVRQELRYTLFYTVSTVPTDPCNPNPTTETGNAADDPRQLGYSDPPDTTVVTWDSYFRDYNADGTIPHIKRDIVLFLGGSAKPMDSANVANLGWKVAP